MKRLVYVIALLAVPPSIVLALVHDWSRIADLLNRGWPPWVGNLANVLQIATPVVALVWALRHAARLRTVEPVEDGSIGLVRFLALLLPARDRERFAREVTANLADFPRPWQRVRELLSVAAAVPRLAVILRWARRRRA